MNIKFQFKKTKVTLYITKKKKKIKTISLIFQIVEQLNNNKKKDR
jgi:hypothetical protein